MVEYVATCIILCSGTTALSLSHCSNMKSIRDITQRELEMGIDSEASWHKQYQTSAYVFIGNV